MSETNPRNAANQPGQGEPPKLRLAKRLSAEDEKTKEASNQVLDVANTPTAKGPSADESDGQGGSFQCNSDDPNCHVGTVDVQEEDDPLDAISAEHAFVDDFPQDVADELIKAVRNLAQFVLAAHENCRKTLDGAYKALETQGEIQPKALPNERYWLKDGQGNITGQAAAVTDPLNGSMIFYAPTFYDSELDFEIGKTTAKKLGLTYAERVLFAYLHELGHATWRFTESGSSKSYREKTSSADKNAQIYRHCFPNAKPTS